MIWNLIGSIGGKVIDIVDDVVEDPERDQEDAAAISGGRELYRTKINSTPPGSPEDSTVVPLKVKKAS